MSRPESADDLVRALGELGKTAVPVEDAQRAAYRRERLVRLLGTQIEGQTQAPARSRYRLLAWVAAAAALLAVGTAGVYELQRAPVAPVAAVAVSAGDARMVLGSVAVKRGAESGSLRPGEVLLGGEIVSTAAASGVEIGIASGRADLAASSELEILRPTASERRLRLGVGRVDVDLPRKLEAGKHLVIETPNADVLVVGTAFTVDVGRDGAEPATHVSVRRGTVWIMQGGKQRAVLRAGDEWKSEAVESRSAPVAAPALPAAAADEPRRGIAAETARKGAGRASVAARVVDSGTLAEENRLFQAGLTARNAGNFAGAADTFSTLLSRYPRSNLREQALAGEFRALDRAGRASAAVIAARRYLASYPSGFARVDAERVANGTSAER